MPENALLSFQTRLSEERLLRPGARPFQPERQVRVDRYWNGRLPGTEEPDNSMLVASLWNSTFLFFYFSCLFERLEVNPSAGTEEACDRLWEHDVVEVFLKPARSPGYFEFEASPLGQWLDLHVLEPRVKVDWTWRSGFAVRTEVDTRTRLWSTCLRIPFQPMLRTAPLARTPEPGEVWRLNLFRAAGREPSRQYYSWRPTFTEKPDFHVPRAFGNLVFLTEELVES